MPVIAGYVEAARYLTLGRLVLLVLVNGGQIMTMMSDGKRRRIVAKRRKLQNAIKRAAKVAKRERNNAG
jgi:hypothetical protein